MSIIKKLNLKKYTNMAVLNQPIDYDTFEEVQASLSNNHDAIVIFIETLDDMVNYTNLIIENEHYLLEKGYLFFAYPKKGNKRYETYIHRDAIFPALQVNEAGYIGDSDIKFARMVSMDDVFTVVGLKREKRKVKKTSPSSQSVSDYEENVQDVEALLTNHPKELQFYQHLTPGYKKDWARYIFSAKQQQTRDKRAEQMVDILSKGYKSIALYRMNKQ